MGSGPGGVGWFRADKRLDRAFVEARRVAARGSFVLPFNGELSNSFKKRNESGSERVDRGGVCVETMARVM